jgi:hypothetical protein
LSPLSTVAFVNVHTDEYNNVVAKLVFFLNSTSTFVNAPILIVSGIKRVSIESRVKVVSPLNNN